MKVQSIPYGAAPWRQTSWDIRAAGNFIGGGAGGGLIVFALLSDATAPARSTLLGIGMALVMLGLSSVGLELGRPLRALNVFRNPRHSWMSREAIVAALLAIAVLGGFAGYEPAAWIAGALALAFMYCQARLLRTARGIPAWNDAHIVALVITTALAEGGGIFWLTAPVHHAGSTRVLAAFAALLIVRAALGHVYRASVARASRPAAAALTGAMRVLLFPGTLLPVVLLASTSLLAYDAAMSVAAVAGALGWLAGANLKLAIITRASFNRGFSLPALPVRGRRA